MFAAFVLYCLIAAVMCGSQGLSNARLHNFSLACVKYDDLPSHTAGRIDENSNEFWVEEARPSRDGFACLLATIKRTFNEMKRRHDYGL